MYENGKIYMGLAGGKRVELALNMCNRHGLIAGASGTGKTVTMKVMAESFSDAGVPVFLCDVKGDVAGICAPGQSSEGMEKRIDKFGLRDRFVYQGYPTTFWDVYQDAADKLFSEQLLCLDESKKNLRLTDYGVDVSNYALAEFLLDY